MYLISIKNIHEYIYVIYIIMYIKVSHCVCMMGPRKWNQIYILIFISLFAIDNVESCFDTSHVTIIIRSFISQQYNAHIKNLTLWLPGRGACQDPDILVYEFYSSSFEAGIANAISSFKWRKIHKCSIYLTKICVILWLRSLTNDDGNVRHVW